MKNLAMPFRFGVQYPSSSLGGVSEQSHMSEAWANAVKYTASPVDGGQKRFFLELKMRQIVTTTEEDKLTWVSVVTLG